MSDMDLSERAEIPDKISKKKRKKKDSSFSERGNESTESLPKEL